MIEMKFCILIMEIKNIFIRMRYLVFIIISFNM